MADIRTVGELIAALAAYPPDTPVMAYDGHGDRLSPVVTVEAADFARVTADVTHQGETFRRGSFWTPAWMKAMGVPAEAFEVVRVATVEG